MNKQKEKSVWNDIYYHTDWSFIINLGQLMATLFFLGFSFEYSVWLYVLKTVAMLSYRLVIYKSLNSHYYMWELCYWINIFGALFLSLRMFNVLPQVWNEYLFRLFYVYAHGTLVWAGYTFGDKVVIHNTQYMISAFVHFSAPLIFWRYRWNWDANALENYPEIDIKKNLGGWMGNSFENLKLVAPSYLLWMGTYTILLFLILKNRINQRTYKTLYKYVMENPKHPITKLINYLKVNNTKLQKTIYLGCHMLSNLLGVLLTGLWFNSLVLNTIFIGGIGFLALYFASTYYQAKLLKIN